MYNWFYILDLQIINSLEEGTVATPDEFSYIVDVISEQNLHECTGSLITNQHVLTIEKCASVGKKILIPKYPLMKPYEVVNVQSEPTDSETKLNTLAVLKVKFNFYYWY